MSVPAARMPVAEREPVLAEPYRSILQEWQDRRENALHDRRKHEPAWHIARSFLAGRQWVGWNPRTRRVVTEANPANRERHTVNLITSYHQTVLGKLYVEDLRPDLLFSREDIESQGVTEHTQLIAKYAWDVEVEGDRRMFRVLHNMLTYGTGAARCLFDPTQGPVIAEVPIVDGEPVMDPSIARDFVAQAQLEGRTVQIEPVREGRIVWEPLDPFSLLVPPGVEDEHDFPYLMIERAMWTKAVQSRYPTAPEDLKAQELEVLETRPRELPAHDNASPESTSKLRDHVLVTTGYEMPTAEYPEGRTITWTGSTILEMRERLPYKLRGKAHHGIVFFHYHRVNGRFWSQGVIEPLIGPQRQINRAASQRIELKDRNLGRVYADKGTFTPMNTPRGKVMEVIEIPMHARVPTEVAGGGIGPWIQAEQEIHIADMDRVAGLHDVTMGKSPSGVTAYAAMALLAEQDERRVGPVLKEIRYSLGDLMLLTLDLVKVYWPEGKHGAVAGPDGRVETFMYRSSLLPSEFYFDVSKGTPLPQSPAMESQKIFDLFNAAIAAGTPLPPEWLKDSLDQGRPLPFPKREEQVQQKNAEYENYLIEKGVPVMPNYYDDDYVHIMAHRHAQVARAGTPGMEQLAQALEMHIVMHMEQIKLKNPGTTGANTNLPQLQGGHGVEGQSGAVNLQGLAQNLNAPPPSSSGGAARESDSRRSS